MFGEIRSDDLESVGFREQRDGASAGERVEQGQARPFGSWNLLGNERENERTQPPLASEIRRQGVEEALIRGANSRKRQRQSLHQGVDVLDVRSRA